MSEWIVLITGFLITIGSGIFSFYYARKENRLAAKSNSNTNIAFFFLILGTFVTFYSGYSSLNKQIAEKNERIKEQNRNDSIQKVNDSIQLLIASRTNELLNVRKQLSDVYQNLAFQNSQTFNALTGGNNKPALIFTAGTQGSILPDENGILDYVNGKMTKQHSIQFSISNLGEFHLKDINIVITDKYSDIKEIINVDENGGMITQRFTQPNFNLTELFYSGKNPFDDYYKRFEINTLAPKQTKKLYNTRAPINGKKYTYETEVQWSNGIYTTKIEFIELDSSIYVRDFQLISNGKTIKNQFAFFDIPLPKELNQLIFCGKIKYQNENFNVYWYKEKQLVCVSRDPFNMIGIQNFFNTTAKTSKECYQKALPMIKKAFD